MDEEMSSTFRSDEFVESVRVFHKKDIFDNNRITIDWKAYKAVGKSLVMALMPHTTAEWQADIRTVHDKG